MKYITGIHALNLSCSLETCGDWHTSALKWEKISFKESDESLFGDWGIEKYRIIPNSKEKYYVANHIRALLDLIDDGKFTVAQGMREDYVCAEKYTAEIFNLVWRLRENKNWTNIESFMKKEYRLDWIKFEGENNG